MKRMFKYRFPKKEYEWIPTGGRPKITWTQGILKKTREKGLSDGAWKIETGK